MSEAHEIYIGGKVDRALQIISEEPNDFELRGRATEEVDHSVELHGNYLHVEVDE